MNNKTQLENSIKAAKAGDNNAQDVIYSKLSERFFTLVTCELRRYPILIKHINPGEKSHEICQHAIAELKRLYPISSTKWSLDRSMSVLHNVLDDFITQVLIDLAKKNIAGAENLLFSILRKKLMERIKKNRWGVSRNEYQNE